MASVAAHATPGFLDTLKDAVTVVAMTRSRFIADDVWYYLGYRVPTSAERRALGPVIRQLAKAGAIVWTGAFLPSQRRHQTPQKVWRASAYAADQLHWVRDATNVNPNCEAHQ